MSNHRLLLVDDDDFTRMTVRAVLASLDYDVIGDAAIVVTAMDLARAGRPDLAVIDLDLGEGPTGIDLAHGLRTLRPAPYRPPHAAAARRDAVPVQAERR